VIIYEKDKFTDPEIKRKLEIA